MLTGIRDMLKEKGLEFIHIQDNLVYAENIDKQLKQFRFEVVYNNNDNDFEVQIFNLDFKKVASKSLRKINEDRYKVEEKIAIKSAVSKITQELEGSIRLKEAEIGLQKVYEKTYWVHALNSEKTEKEKELSFWRKLESKIKELGIY